MFNSSILKFVVSRRFPAREKQPRLGDLLVEARALDPDDLAMALALQKREKAKLGEIILANEMAQQTDIDAALDQQFGLGFVDLSAYIFNPDVLRILDPKLALRLQCVVIDQAEDQMLVAVSDPTLIDQIKTLPELYGCRLGFVRADRQQILRLIVSHNTNSLVERARDACPADLSCRTILSKRARAFLLSSVVLIVLTLVLSGLLGAALFVWIGLALVFNSGFKILCLRAYLRRKRRYKFPLTERKQPLPKVSIMVPIYKEANILPRLVSRMAKLDYPKELLEILLVCEQDDIETRDHLNETNLPFWLKPVFVPNDTLRTKPRALNYALDFCHGEIIGVYDAEDAPEPDQVFKVVAHLQRAKPRVACVQASLDYYNARTNWISRCFTIEYAILFRVILRGLQAMRLPIPLGGTSVFFRRDVLEKLGLWDAYNVTEDADLGMRLHRQGYRCEMIDSTTYEEANYRFVPWVKQRSRWLKGFLLTWGTHIRNPMALYRDLGMRGFIVFNILFLGTVSAFLSAPLVLPLWLFTFGVEIAAYEFLTKPVLTLLIAAFITTELTLLTLGFVATRRAGLNHLTRWLPTMVLYWPLGCFAAYKALYEIIVRPIYWDKTTHGLNDADYQAEIDRLTSPTPSTEKWKSQGTFTSTGAI